jgi:hypothetical protein
MDHQFDHREMYDQNGNGYNPDEYDSNDYNGTNYGGTQFILDAKLYYLLIGVIIYSSCCFLRNRSRIRDTDLNVSIINNDNSKIIEKVKKNIVSLEEIDKSSICSICLEDFNSEKDISILDCKHIYHMDCIIEWINKDPSCPLCRTNSLF